MEWANKVTNTINQLLGFAIKENLIEAVDAPYYRNLLLDVMELDAPTVLAVEQVSHPTATPMLNELTALAMEKGLIGSMQYEKDLFAARIMGLLTPSPKDVRTAFAEKLAAGDAKGAVDDFYHMCCACDYIKVDAIAQNVRYFADSKCGELEITINLSKPEKDPKEIAKLKNAPSVGYPLCMLCVENPGYAGRSNFPARQNHRVIPVKLAGDDWCLQYSPYAYYHEHCIVFNSQHTPMKISRGTFERLFRFVEQFPHYFLGSNADLPIVGGSILNHDHFQGGCYQFPMDRAEKKLTLSSAVADVQLSILDWPMSTLCLEGEDPEPMIAMAEAILNAWRGYSDESCQVLAFTGKEPHNTITPILRKQEKGYKLMLVLRNNRTSSEHPLGIFHPHAPLHHIKKENIGLIEVMGLFILPGRLKTELKLLEGYLTGEKPLVTPAEDAPEAKHFPWLKDIVARQGLCATAEAAEILLRKEVAEVCAQVLCDAGVYKQDDSGLEGMLRFVRSTGLMK